MSIETARAVFALNMIGDETPEWIPMDSEDGIQVAFMNDALRPDGTPIGRDGWQSVIPPAPFTHTALALVYTSAENMALLKADTSGRWEWREDCVDVATDS